MTAPNQSSPDGSLGIGDFASWQAMTASDAKNKMKIPLNAWNGAQDGFSGAYAKGDYVHREVVRLDNRIDEIVVADQRAQIATFSTDGTWTKPPGTYKIVVDVMAGSSGGGRSNNGGSGGASRNGTGGFSGGWSKMEYEAGVVPGTVPVVVGSGGAGGGGDGVSGAPGGDSSFGSLLDATGGGAGAFGEGNWSFRIRGGIGGRNNAGEAALAGSQGGSGSFDPGGLGGPGGGARGENGYSVGAAKVGMGSGGGGGGAAGTTGNGGRGGDGGWPSGPGGGGGSYLTFGFAGNGGAGAGGAVYITSYYRDTAGNPPTQPTNVTASAVTQSTATITWTASTDDVRVEKYLVILGSVEIGETSGTQYHLSQLSAATEYTVQIVAVDLGNNRSTAGAVTFTTT